MSDYTTDYIDSTRYTSEVGSEVTCTLVHTKYGCEVRVIQRFQIIFEVRAPMVFGTIGAGQAYLNAIKRGDARPLP